MPLPRAVARLNKRFTNQFIEPVIRRFPGFIVVEHRGRRTGLTYRTPLYAFETGDGSLLVALTYGVCADWAQNVVVGGGSVHRDGAETTIGDVERVGRGSAERHLPVAVRTALRLMRVTDFLVLR